MRSSRGGLKNEEENEFVTAITEQGHTSYVEKGSIKSTKRASKKASQEFSDRSPELNKILQGRDRESCRNGKCCSPVVKEGTYEENWKEFEATKESLSSNWEDVTRNRTHHMHLIKEWDSCETHTRTTLKKAQSPSACHGDRHGG